MQLHLTHKKMARHKAASTNGWKTLLRVVQHLGKSGRDMEKSVLPIAPFPVWKRVFSGRQSVPRRAMSTRRSFGIFCPQVQIANCPAGIGSDRGGQCSPAALVPLAPAGPQQLAHDGDVKWVCCSGEAEDAEEGQHSFGGRNHTLCLTW